MSGTELLVLTGAASKREKLAVALRPARSCCRKLNSNRYFQLVMLFALTGALFLPDIWVWQNIEDITTLDVMLGMIMFLFLVEFIVQCLGLWKSYAGSFFFWMDIIGALSLVLDFSFSPLDVRGSAQVMRAARITKLGARAGRFTKLVKLLRFLPGMHQQGGVHGTAKHISSTLITALSTRVSFLIIFMVVVLPLVEMVALDDYSVAVWMKQLDITLASYPSNVTTVLEDFDLFFNQVADVNYYPFEITWSNDGTPVTYEFQGRFAPIRNSSILTFSSAGVSGAEVKFNFEDPFQIESLCQILLIIVIISAMIGFSLLLSNSVSAIVLQPLEHLLSSVQWMASTMFKSVASMQNRLATEEDMKKDDNNSNGEGNKDALFNETKLLEKVVEKLAALSEITIKKSPMDMLEQLGEEDRAVLQGFGGGETSGLIQMSQSSDADVEDNDGGAGLVLAIERHFEEVGISWQLVADSWDFNPIELEDNQRHAVVLCFLTFHHGALGKLAEAEGVDSQLCLNNFVESACAGYLSPKKVHYHNWNHAVDVAHTTFRLLNILQTDHFFSALERFALVVSAVCHDIGHPGLNNPFLVETAAELAIRYNDHSPLENMHCAKLFEIVNQPKSSIFRFLDKSQYREVRQVCIEAILHTDNTHHFSMVKELQMAYEMNSHMFDTSRKMYHNDPMDYPPKEVCDQFKTADTKKLLRNFCLHYSDISNPCKPFQICAAWARLIVKEFFEQGDQEKELGIAVQPLNDRDKINIPQSQVGFIEFFVAPFAHASVKLMPPVEHCLEQLIRNLYSWQDEWLTTTEPKPPEDERAKMSERLAKLEAKYQMIAN